MPTERTFCTRLNDLLRTRHGMRQSGEEYTIYSVDSLVSGAELRYPVHKSNHEGADLLRVKYTASCGHLQTVVLELEGGYGPDASGRCLIRRKTLINAKQLIPWNPKVLCTTLNDWFHPA